MSRAKSLSKKACSFPLRLGSSLLLFFLFFFLFLCGFSLAGAPRLSVFLPAYRLTTPKEYFRSSVLDVSSLSTKPQLKLEGAQTLLGHQTLFSGEAGDPSFLRHLGETIDRLIYFAAEPSPDGGLVFSDKLLQNLNRLKKLKALYGTEIVLSVAGDSNSFVPALRGKSKQKKLSAELLTLSKKYRLDGINIDWEFPEKRQLRSYEDFLRILRRDLSSLPKTSLEITAYYNRPLTKDIYRTADRIHLFNGRLFSPKQNAIIPKIAVRFLQTVYGVPLRKISPVLSLSVRTTDWRKVISYRSFLRNPRSLPDLKEQFSEDKLKEKLKWIQSQNFRSVSVWEAGQDSRERSRIAVIRNFLSPK